MKKKAGTIKDALREVGARDGLLIMDRFMGRTNFSLVSRLLAPYIDTLRNIANHMWHR